MEIIAIIYLGWAFYSGWKFLSGRNEWLDSREIPNKMVKIFLSVVVGYVIGAFYALYLILRLLGIFGM